jgi:hypothetical protein
VGESKINEVFRNVETESTKAKRYVDFPRACLHYKLDEDVPESYAKMLTYERLQYVSKKTSHTKHRVSYIACRNR